MRDIESIKALNSKEVIKSNIKMVCDELKSNNGLTLSNDFQKVVYDSGYQVSIKDYYIVRYGSLLENTLIELLYNISKSLINDNMCIGLWIDKGMLYIDNSIHVESKETALDIAKINNQKAIYSWHDKKSIKV